MLDEKAASGFADLWTISKLDCLFFVNWITDEFHQVRNLSESEQAASGIKQMDIQQPVFRLETDICRLRENRSIQRLADLFSPQPLPTIER